MTCALSPGSTPMLRSSRLPRSDRFPAGLEDERYEQLRPGLVIREGGRELFREELFFPGRAVGEVGGDDGDHDQAEQADGKRGADHGEDDAGVDGVPDE